MPTDRWREVERIYHAALERDPDRRAAFLREACGDDEALRLEVQSLLEFDEPAVRFLERPALEQAARGLAEEPAPHLAPGRIAGYEILSLVGAGGMGEVYRARDLRLGREVALKVLARAAAGGPADLRRFEDEARLASGLNHPNIVTIYGVGEAGELAYIAMELVRGRTLRESLTGRALPASELLPLSVQLADALAAAHASGIVHRDLKPENVMVTPEGRVKVLDFGIARRFGEADPRPATGADVPATQTAVGTILGTVGYMSPEQAAGEAARHTSDQFAFGIILYEMLSGRRAFERETKAMTLDAIVHEEPEPIEGLRPEALRNVLARCLAKDPADRYLDTGDLASELHRIRGQWERAANPAGLTRRRAIWLAGAAAAVGVAYWRLWPRDRGIRSLAVLPFVNALKDESVEYVCDGIAWSVIRGISRLPSLSVKPRSAVSNFKGKGVDPREAGRKLAADAVVTGTVTRHSGRLRVTAELMEVANGARLWSQTYDRAASDLLSVQEEIARAIVDKGIRLRLSADERRQLVRSPTRDPAAFELYLRAIHAIEDETELGYLGARDFLQQAVARDQSFALAYVALATTHSLLAGEGFESPAEALPEITRNVRRALDFDPDLPDAHSEAAAVLFGYQWDWAGSEKEWDRAMQSRGGGFVPDFLAGHALCLWALGRADEALALSRKARELDPLSPFFILKEAGYLLQTGQLEEAAGLYEKVIGADRNDSRAYFGLAEVRRAQGRFDEAIEAQRRGYRAEGDDSLAKVFATARGIEGYQAIEKAEAKEQLDALQNRRARGAYASPLEIARAYARLRDKKRALDSLDAALAERSPGLVFLKVDRSWDSVRDDPRFLAAVRRVGLP